MGTCAGQLSGAGSHGATEATARGTAALKSGRQPRNSKSMASSAARANAVPAQGPRDRVKKSADIWTVRARIHKPAFPQSLGLLIGSTRAMVAVNNETGMVIARTEAAKMGPPMVEVVRC